MFLSLTGYYYRTFGMILTSRFCEAGEIVAMMDVLVRPPRESCRRRVNLLSLKTIKHIPSTPTKLIGAGRGIKCHII